MSIVAMSSNASGVKRARSGSAGSSAPGARLTKTQIAQMIGARNSAHFPVAQYGRAFHKRGTDINLANFGATYKEATQAQKENRQVLGYSGKGLYTGGGKYSFGKNLRKFAGSSVGQALQRGAVRGIGLMTGGGLYEGSGEYKNVLISGSNHFAGGARSPMDETGSVVYTARQFVRTITAPASAAFTVSTIPINPGLEEAFPWLSAVALNFEEYEIQQLVYEYESTISDNLQTTAGQVGTVIMAVDYNSNDDEFVNMEQMLQYHGAVGAKVTDNISCGVEADSGKGRIGGAVRFVRSGPVRLNSDAEEYDVGTLNIAFNNTATGLLNQQVGYLWVYYTIKFLKPKLMKNRGEDVRMFQLGCTANQTSALIFGNVGNADLLLNQQNSFRCAVSYSGSNVAIVFPTWLTGDFRVCLRVEGVDLTYAGTEAIPTNSIPQESGQVSLLQSIYASSTTLGDNPNSYMTLMLGATGLARLFQMECIVRLKAAVGGVNNQLLIRNPITGGTVTQAVLEIVETNTTGHISASNSAVKWVTYNDSTVTGTMG